MQIKKGIQAQILKLVIKSQENKRGREEERPYKNKFKRIKKNGNKNIHINKECSNYNTISLISHASKVMLKILQVSLQQWVN